jgi:GMP synthase (glutamine-hydrolysing)
MRTQIAVIDYGSQYSQLIVRRLRALGYFSKLYLPGRWDDIGHPAAVVLSGGPARVNDPGAPDIDFDRLQALGCPVLGICYGMQLLNRKFGGTVAHCGDREYGPAAMELRQTDPLLKGLPAQSTIWMSHSDSVSHLPAGCEVLAVNPRGTPVAVRWNECFYGIQFHPEVSHTEYGNEILRNFLALAGEKPGFSMEQLKDQLIDEARREVAGREVVCAVSGGVDSTVLAVLLHAAGAKMHPIFVDNGLLRRGEADEVVGQFRRLGIDIDRVDAADRFLARLAGITDPEEKRRRIGDEFIDVFFSRAGRVELLAQGTLYPDIIESATSGSQASRIKTHHNRVDRILELQAEGRLLEPLAELFKDDVRALGAALDIPHDLLHRHPFPGPGLAVRVVGEITRARLETCRAADAIFIGELKTSGAYDTVWQAGAALLPVRTVGVKGDERTYEETVSLRAVTSLDAMTADWAPLPHDLLARVSNRILNEVPGINRVLYDISTKPPAGIEWE